MEERARRSVGPIRRKLMGCAVAQLAGAYLAGRWPEMGRVCLFACAALSAAALARAFRKRSAFFCALLAFFCLGWGLAGRTLSLRDAPTAPGSLLAGRVARIVSENRVVLEGVTVDGESGPARPCAVTLMAEEGEAPRAVFVGQTVEGTGRLFAQEEPRNPGGVNRRVQALADGYELSGYILPGWTARGEAVFSAREAIRRAREALLAAIDGVFGEDAPLYRALLLGERKGIDEDVVRSMRLTGTAHLLTVSGLHLSLAAAALDALLRRVRWRRRVRAAAKGALLTLFCALTGGAPGTVRALIMALLRELAALRGRRYDPLTALSAAAMLSTLACPVLPLDGSFQFSYFVVLGILLLNGRLSALSRQLLRRAPGTVRALGSALCVSACAQLAALPMQLLFYGYVPLLALPMNFVSGALMPLFMGTGALCTAAGCVSLPLGRALAGVLSVPGRLFERASVALAGLSGAILRLPAPYALCLPLAAALLALAGDAVAFRRRARRLAPVLAAVLALAYLPRFCPAARYVQLDVGQGDAALLRRGRRAVLLDVGPADSYDALRYLRREGLFVDAVVLSHLDEDHAGALGVLLGSEVALGRVLMPERAREDAGSLAVLTALDACAAQDVAVEELAAGDAFEAAGTPFSVLSPDESLSGSNERSLVLFAQAEGVRILTTGDLPAACEPEDVPACDVLKVAHHGSAYATSDAFALRASPRVALISVGADNRYGHPAPRVLEALAAAGADVYRTDERGCVIVWLRDGQTRVQTFVAPP